MTNIMKSKAKTKTMWNPYVSFHINQKFKTIKSVANLFGAKMPPRKGYCLIGHLSRMYGVDVSLWCPSIDPNGKWGNKPGDPFLDTILERKVPKETRENFVKRTMKNKKRNYNPDELRLTFVKINGEYVFAGIYRMSNIDIDNCEITFKRINYPCFKMVVITQRTLVVTVQWQSFIQIDYTNN